MLLDVLDGIPLSAAETRILTWVASWPPERVEVIAGLIHRARRAGGQHGH